MEKTLEQVLEEYKEIVRAKAGLYFIMGGDSEDLIQEGMIGLVNAYNSFDEGKGASFRTYAELCINRQMISAVKAAGRLKNSPLNLSVSLDKPISDEEGAPSLGETLEAPYTEDPEHVAIYGELLSLLLDPENGYFSDFEQEVLRLLIGGLSYKEIAEKLDKSPKQIDNTIQRIKKKLRLFLA